MELEAPKSENLVKSTDNETMVENVAVVVVPEVVDGVQEDQRQRDSNGIIVGEWRTGIFSCCDDCVPNGWMSFCCPCFTFGQIAARVGMMDYFIATVIFIICLVTGFGSILAWLLIWYMRRNLRQYFKIPGSFVEDCCCTFWCSCCVLTQMASHTESYDKGACSFEQKSMLPGYTIVQQQPAV